MDDLAEVTLLIDRLVRDAMTRPLSLDTIRTMYHMAASGEWRTSLAVRKILIYALLTNPRLIEEFEPDVQKILDEHPSEAELRSGWKYIRQFAASPAGGTARVAAA